MRHEQLISKLAGMKSEVERLPRFSGKAAFVKMLRDVVNDLHEHYFDSETCNALYIKHKDEYDAIIKRYSK